MSEAALRFAREADLLLEAATAAGAADAEAFFHHGVELTVRAFDGDVETLTSAEGRGVGLRVFSGTRMGFAHTSDLTEAGLRELVSEAVEAARYNEPDDFTGLPDEQPDGPLPGLVAADFDSLGVEDRVAMAVGLETRTRSRRPEVSRTSGAVYADERGHTELATTRGVRAAYEATMAYAYVEAVAERDGEMQAGWSFTFGRAASELDLDLCARESADRAAGLLGAARLPTRTCPVVIEPWAAASLLGTLASSISAEAVQKGRSLLAGRLGDLVASPALTLVDDGRLPEGLASRPWDGEGVPTRRTPILEAGVLRSYLHNSYTARRDGSARSTGNASRGSHRSSPELAPSNLVVVPGVRDQAALMEAMGDGVLVTDLHGLHTVNPVTGEFSLGINGFTVEGGRAAAPLREMTVAGRLLDLLAAVEEVGSDLRFSPGAGFVGAPSLLVGSLTVSGT